MTAAQPVLSTAVIGCGAISQHHLDYLVKSPHTRLIALCDRSPALASAAAARYGGAETFVDAQTMLARCRPDVVHVLTPPGSHDALVRAALSARAHVICEKPMTGTAAQTRALLDAAQTAGKALVESRNLLFCDPVVAITDVIASGRLGVLRECDILLQVDFLAGPFGDLNLSGPAVNLPAGAVHDFLPHLAYLFEHLTGTDAVDQVHGRLANLSANARAGYDFLDVLLAAGDKRGRLRIASDIGPAAFRIMVRGSAASIETDLYHPFPGYSGPPDIGKRAPLGQMREGLRLARAGLRNLHGKIAQKGADYGIHAMLDACYRAFRAQEIPPIRPADMLTTATLIDRITALKVAP